MMNIDQLPNQNLYQYKVSRAKRTFDFIASLVALIILSPVFPIIALAIVFTSRGPVLYRQLSVGKSTPEKMDIFKIMKFRSMYEDADRTYGVMPDIIGLAQVDQGYNNCIEDVRRKVGFDHNYALSLCSVKSWITTDLSIITKTIVLMVEVAKS